MYLKKRLEKLENQINISYVRLHHGDDDEIIKTTARELVGVLHEILEAERQNKTPEHRLLEKGLLEAAEGQNEMLDLINIINQSIKENEEC